MVVLFRAIMFVARTAVCVVQLFWLCHDIPLTEQAIALTPRNLTVTECDKISGGRCDWHLLFPSSVQVALLSVTALSKRQLLLLVFLPRAAPFEPSTFSAATSQCCSAVLLCSHQLLPVTSSRLHARATLHQNRQLDPTLLKSRNPHIARLWILTAF